MDKDLATILQMARGVNDNRGTARLEIVVSGQIEVVHRQLPRPQFSPAPGSNVVPASRPVSVSTASLQPAKWVRRMLDEA